VKLFLDVNHDGTTDLTLSTTTNATGGYLFTNLIGGADTVSISPPPGIVATSDLDGDGSADSAHAFILPYATTHLTEDFGLYGYGSIGDRVWFDQDTDGVQDAGEIGITGVTVSLDVDLDSNGTYEGILTTTTGANGSYPFVGLPAGA
jgi:hypothetical protein